MDGGVDGEDGAKGKEADDERQARVQALRQGQGDAGGKDRQQQGPVAGALALGALTASTLAQQGRGPGLDETIGHHPEG